MSQTAHLVVIELLAANPGDISPTSELIDPGVPQAVARSLELDLGRPWEWTLTFPNFLQARYRHL